MRLRKFWPTSGSRDTWEWPFISNASTENGVEMGQDDDEQQQHRKRRDDFAGTPSSQPTAVLLEPVKCPNAYPVPGLFLLGDCALLWYVYLCSGLPLLKAGLAPNQISVINNPFMECIVFCVAAAEEERDEQEEQQEFMVCLESSTLLLTIILMWSGARTRLVILRKAQGSYLHPHHSVILAGFKYCHLVCLLAWDPER